MKSLLIQNFSDVDALSSEEFEFFVKEVLEASGWTDLKITELNHDFKHGDGGIDIIGRKNGVRFAFEVKQRSGSPVDVSALNQLNTGAELYRIKHKVLVTNSNFTSEVRKRADMLGIDLVDREELSSLWLGSRNNLGREYYLRTYQRAIVDEIVFKVQDNHRNFIIEMATGLGKTLTSAFLCKEIFKALGIDEPRILFLAHQIELLKQAKRTYRNIFKLGVTYGLSEGGGIPADTHFLFSTFQTLHKHVREMDPKRFDIVLVDEAHHTAANTYDYVVKYFEPRVRIGLTATPYRMDSKNIVVDYFGGHNGHVGRYDLIWAIKNRKLAFPIYNVLIDDIDDGELAKINSGASKIDIDKWLFLHKKDEEIVREIESYIQKSDLEYPKVVIYCKSIAHLNHFMQFLPIGTATFVHSKMGKAERTHEILAFQEGLYKYILVVDLFNEGIDIPEINVLVFLRSTHSPIIWHQQLGRGLRRTSGKKVLHVLDFIGSIQTIDQTRQFLKHVLDTSAMDDENMVDLEEPGNRRHQIVHDQCMKVQFSRNAAKVFELLKKQRFCLADRTKAICVLRKFHEENEFVPTLEDFVSCIPEISGDQIQNLFQSYYRYVKAADLVDEEFLSRIKVKYNTIVHDFYERNGVAISCETLALDSTCLHSCPEVIAADLKAILGNSDNLKPVEKEMLHQVKNQENDDEIIELDNYIGKVSSFEDLAGLPEKVRDKITNKFDSELDFLQFCMSERVPG